MMTEFDALLDGLVEMPEFSRQRLKAVYAQIDGQLNIRGLLFFGVPFTGDGHVAPEWNIPLQQLVQSAGRGPDLGAGPIRLVCKSQCSVPWHQENLWDPSQKMLQLLMQTVSRNKLGIIREQANAAVAGDGWDDDIPVLAPAAVPPTLVPAGAEPPLIKPAFGEIPVLAPVMVPTLMPGQIPVAMPVAAPAAAVAVPVTPVAGGVDANAYVTLKQEFDAMRAAHAVRIDKLQKERDEYKDKLKGIADSLKEQAREQLQSMREEAAQELEQKNQQMEALKAQIEIEKNRYAELKEQLALQAQRYQAEREELVERMKHDIDSEKIEGLKEAFKKELDARLEAETSRVSEALVMREVELFYREEQLNLFRDEIRRLREERQSLIRESGRQVLEALENNGVTLVAYNVGVGHMALPLEDVGRYLDERLQYLADRCGVSPEIFAQWQEHYHHPVCHHVDEKGEVCSKPVKRTDLASQFVKGTSDRCIEHQPVVAARSAGS